MENRAAINERPIDERYYQVATPGSLAERVTTYARDGIYRDFLRYTRPSPNSTILDVGVSDLTGEAANVLERKYPHLNRVTAVGLGVAHEFQATFPQVAYRQIEAGERLPFGDREFDIATSNAVLEHVGCEAAQRYFVAELVRVATTVFISVPHRFFPLEHHTAIPLAHWTNPTFRFACRIWRKDEWSDPKNLILMTSRRLRQLHPGQALVGKTGIRLGPWSSNLFMLIR